MPLSCHGAAPKPGAMAARKYAFRRPEMIDIMVLISANPQEPRFEMTDSSYRLRTLMVCGSMFLMLLGGCASTGNPQDPLEPINRGIYQFNDGLDKAVLKPVAEAYRGVLPQFARTGISNFFANINDVIVALNNLLQGKIPDAVSDAGRVVVNSTVGILGVLDVATEIGLEKHNEDFGQTLGRWGVGSGAYVVLPFLGSSSVRDGFGLLAVDWQGDPLWYVGNVPTRNELYGVRVVDTRANLLDASQLMEDAALDRYSYLRGAYQQRRRSLIYDGNPPREPDPDRTSKSPSGTEPDAQAGREPAARVAKAAPAPVAEVFSPRDRSGAALAKFQTE